jgi:hypothetical protein
VPDARARFKRTWEDGNLSIWVRRSTAPFFFLAGAVLSHFLGGGLEQLPAEWVVVAVLALAIVVMAITIVSRFGSQDLLVRQQRAHAVQVFTRIKELSDRLPVTASLIQERDGKTYTETSALIRKAQRSLVFVDIWEKTDSAHPNPYHARDSPEYKARAAYYAAIVTRLDAGIDISYKRIIQLDPNDGLEDLASDEITFGHIGECARIMQRSSGVAELLRADKSFWSNIAIIDGRHVVHTLLVVKDGRPRRHAAIVYDDPAGTIVNMYNQLVAALAPRPLENVETAIRPSGG